MQPLGAYSGSDYRMRYVAKACRIPIVVVTVVACSGDPTSPAGTPVPSFSSPIAGTPMAELFYGAYRDQGFRDYACGVKYYAGHLGTDILLRNFRVQDSGVAVLAAAPGRVAGRVDGLFDRNTVNTSGGLGNQVTLTHDAGVVSIYGHLRLGSVRVAPGDEVSRGDTLGLVGSSGNSSWPHLHFELRRNGTVIDPFIGSCNPGIGGHATWLDQLPYQSEFQVVDEGITTDPLTLAGLLERPDDVDVVTAADGSFSYWLSLFNVQAAELRTELRDGTGTVVYEARSSGPVQTFSVRFFAVQFGVDRLGNPGTHTLVVYLTPLGFGTAEREIARREFLFSGGDPPSPAGLRFGPLTPEVWLSPDGGEPE